MAIRFDRSDWQILTGAVLGLLIFIWMYPRLSPEAAIQANLDREQVLAIADTLSLELGYSNLPQDAAVEFKVNSDQIRYLNQRYGTSRANHAMTDSVPAFYWEIRWQKPDSNRTEIEIGESVPEQAKWMSGVRRLQLDMSGRPLAFVFRERPGDPEASGETPPDFVMSGSASRKMAFNFAEQVIPDIHTNWTLTASPDSCKARRFCTFKWERNRSICDQTVRFQIQLADNKISDFKKEYIVPTIPSTEKKRQSIFETISFIIQYLVILILGLTYFVRRLKSDTLDLKSGLIPALIILLCWAVVFWLQVSGQRGWEMLLGFAITTPFVAGGIWLMFILGEAVSREVWQDKLATIDGLRRRFLFPALGKSLLHGIGMGGVLIGLYAVLSYMAVNFGNGYFTLGDVTLDHWSAPFPGLHILAKTLLASLYIVTTYCLFFQSWIRSRFRNLNWFYGILFLFWTFVSLPLPGLMPFTASIIHNGILGAVIVLFFVRSDFIATTAALFSTSLFYYMTAAFFIGGGFTWHALLLLGLLLFLIVYAVLSLRSRVLLEQMEQYVPEYMQRVYERERIERELEIARNVQLNFLPRGNPKVNGLEVASFCIPAMEVGGDYFDFVHLGPQKLGVAIGDVSGKGIPAAFYMTLTKGLLQSLAHNILSPKEILINLNKLFYENAERGIFISMIYTIFDLETRKLYTARAGHNPMLIRRSGTAVTEELCPDGIALGFEPGELFAKTIQEAVFELKPGDVFLFYTDGLNEAQNRLKREFGEDRLKRVMLENGAGHATDLLKSIRDEINQFTGDAQQHDDMTAVVIKILHTEAEDPS